MRVCRYRDDNAIQLGFYDDDGIVPLEAAFRRFAAATGERVEAPTRKCLLGVLPPDGESFAITQRVATWFAENADQLVADRRPPDAVELLVPLPRPDKLFLLAGNYAKHIEEGGGIAAERAETFPYVFMKPPLTTLTDPSKTIHIPRVSPDHIDWEIELAVVIGRRARHVSEADALNYVGGYTIVNDISDRQFRPNPNRKERPRDAFFDWLHGKWHDSFCPCGPCIATPATVPDPQTLDLELSVNGKTFQQASTAQQIFPVAAVIEFVSRLVTLEPGDIISTGTPQGVGKSTGTFLRSGDQIVASIASIGKLVTPVADEA